MTEVKKLAPAPFRRSKHSNKGAGAEAKVQEFLDRWSASSTSNEANRLVDTKAAGRVIKAAAADFEFFSFDGLDTCHGLIEVKETEHEYRLSKNRLTQFARLRKRAKCGGLIFVLVYHSTLQRWRCMTDVDLGPISAQGSWDLRHIATFKTAEEALQAESPWWRC